MAADVHCFQEWNCTWHRTADDQGRPYHFVSVEQLLDDFFREAERLLSEQGVAFEIVDDEEN